MAFLYQILNKIYIRIGTELAQKPCNFFYSGYFCITGTLKARRKSLEYYHNITAKVNNKNFESFE